MKIRKGKYAKSDKKIKYVRRFKTIKAPEYRTESEITYQNDLPVERRREDEKRKTNLVEFSCV